MTVIDFHPDDLIDRDARGLLSADEKRRLGEHLAQCVACRMELQLRADFDAELGMRASGTSMQDFVSSALIAAHEAARAEPVVQAAPRGRRVNTRVLLLVAASLLLVSGLAAAQAGLVTRVIRLAQMTIGLSASAPRDEKPARKVKKAKPPEKRRDDAKPNARELGPTRVAAASGSLPAAPEATAGLAPAAQTAAALEPALAAEQAVALTPELPLDEPREMQSAHTNARRTHARHARARARAARVELGDAPQAALEPTAGAAAANTAQGLFERAGEARREGRWLEASGLYQELAARFARSPEARLSLVLVARMQLDRGEPRAALGGFEAYLATSDGALREEALAGKALAYRRLGNVAEERESVRALLREYPDSPYGRRALERLERGTP